jgi:hypothetical protein
MRYQTSGGAGSSELALPRLIAACFALGVDYFQVRQNLYWTLAL